MGRVLSGRPELEAAWRMFQHLYGMYVAADDEEANQALAAFIEVWQESGLDEFDKLVETLLEWGDEIFAFHDTGRVTNGRIEGTNNKLGVLKRVAYGFVNTTNFAARALLQTGSSHLSGEWRVLMRGGVGRLGHVTPPAWSRHLSR